MSFLSSISGHLGRFVKERFNPQGRGAILYFHRMLERNDAFYPDDINSNDFENLLAALKPNFEFVPLSEITLPTSSGKPPLGIAFDDGYKDNLLALPVLESFNAPATIFVATAGVHEGILWQDRIVETLKIASSEHLLNSPFSYQGKRRQRVAIAQQLMADWKRLPVEERDSEISSLMRRWEIAEEDLPILMLNERDILTLSRHPLISLGAHTHDHAILTTVSDSEAKKQIQKSHEVLTSITGVAPSLFCYPNGKPGVDFTDEHAEMVRSLGFHFAYTTADGGVDRDVDAMKIPRFLPFRKQALLRALSTIKIAGEIA